MKLLNTLLLFTCLLGSLYAQSSSELPSYWVIKLSDRDTVGLKIKISEIVSISMNTYMLNSKIPITELTVNNKGNHSLRFYTIRTDLIADSDASTKKYVEEFLRNAEQNCRGIVPTKTYPYNTQNHTMEFYIARRSELKKIYEALEKILYGRIVLETKL